MSLANRISQSKEREVQNIEKEKVTFFLRGEMI